MVALSLACGAYDRTLPLVDGRVRVEGVSLSAVALPVEEVFYRTATYREFDVAEMSFSSYLLTLERDAPFIAIPAFPSRAFRHNGIYVNAASGITKPEQLRGRTVGVPEYQVTAAVWIRGILAEFHGVPADSVRYRTGGLYRPGRTEKLPVSPPGVEIKPIPVGQTLGRLLAEGELDAIYTPRVPPEFTAGDPRIRRLYADPRAAEIEYFRATGIFPIMHTVVIRREVYQRDRWLATSLLKAFTAAKELATAALLETAALAAALPFAYQEAEELVALMGRDYWPYGLGPNRLALETLVRYSCEQGLIAQRPAVEELFAPETLTSFVI
jgi:4,5-dihydroxyphthalate decarboxylase